MRAPPSSRAISSPGSVWEKVVSTMSTGERLAWMSGRSSSQSSARNTPSRWGGTRAISCCPQPVSSRERERQQIIKRRIIHNTSVNGKDRSTRCRDALCPRISQPYAVRLLPFGESPAGRTVFSSPLSYHICSLPYKPAGWTQKAPQGEFSLRGLERAGKAEIRTGCAPR